LAQYVDAVWDIYKMHYPMTLVTYVSFVLQTAAMSASSDLTAGGILLP